jgi:HSP20 family protein
MTKKKKAPLWFEDSVDEIKRMQEEILRNTQGIRIPWLPIKPLPIRPLFGARFIHIRMAETDNELILRAELPGFSKDEIKLKVTPTTVDISAEKKKVSIEKGDQYFRQEKAYGSARRVVPLPMEVKTEGVKAKFENGILDVVMPKKEVKKKEEKEVKVE